MKDLKVTYLNAIKAKCHDCMAYYLDVKGDCKNKRCPLYAFMPYAQFTPNLEWTKYHPKRQGRTKLSDIHISPCNSHFKPREEVIDNGLQNGNDKIDV